MDQTFMHVPESIKTPVDLGVRPVWQDMLFHSQVFCQTRLGVTQTNLGWAVPRHNCFGRSRWDWGESPGNSYILKHHLSELRLGMYPNNEEMLQLRESVVP